MSRKNTAASNKNAKAETKATTAASSRTVLTPPWSPSAFDEPVPWRPSTSLVAKGSTLSTPPPKQYALQESSAASPGLFMVSIGTAIASKHTNLSVAVAPDEYGLSDQKHIMNEKDLASVLATVLADKVGYNRQRRKLFKVQFKEYFPKLGADNERIFAMLTNEKLWFHNSIHIAYKCVNMSVVQLLVQIVEYTGTVLWRKKHLTPSV